MIFPCLVLICHVNNAVYMYILYIYIHIYIFHVLVYVKITRLYNHMTAPPVLPAGLLHPLHPGFSSKMVYIKSRDFMGNTHGNRCFMLWHIYPQNCVILGVNVGIHNPAPWSLGYCKYIYICIIYAGISSQH